jgi:hypothetical protein
MANHRIWGRRRSDKELQEIAHEMNKLDRTVEQGMYREVLKNLLEHKETKAQR